MRWLGLVMVALVVAGCAYVPDIMPHTRTGTGPQLVVELEQGVVVYDLDMEKPEVVDPFIRKVDGGFYDGMYVHRVVPGLLLMTGEGNWVRKAAWSISVPEGKGRLLGNGALGLVQNADGTFGPYVTMMLGRAVLERGVVPGALAFGRLAEGREVLAQVRKGDKIIRMYGRGFGARQEALP